MISADDKIILKAQVNSLKEEIKNCSFALDVKEGVLNIDFHSLDDALELKKKEGILELCKLRLGVAKLSIYACSFHIRDYNLGDGVRIDDMITTLEKPLAETNGVNGVKEEQVIREEGYVTENWISFDALASSLGYPPMYVEETIEKNQIPGILRQGTWGLGREGVAKFFTCHVESQKKSVFNLMASYSNSAHQQILEKPSETPIEVEEVESTNITQQTQKDISMSLPANFDILEGRRRRPDIKTGLDIALSLLPGGREEGAHRGFYLEQIVLQKKAGNNFISKLASQWTNKKANEELQHAARELYRKMNED